MDTAASHDIHVHLYDNIILKFRRVESGLYMLHHTHHSNNNNIGVTNYSMLNLVSENEQHFTSREISLADVVCDLYQSITMPGYAKFHRLVD